MITGKTGASQCVITVTSSQPMFLAAISSICGLHCNSTDRPGRAERGNPLINPLACSERRRFGVRDSCTPAQRPMDLSIHLARFR